jgi:hypothetical protein
MFFDEVQEIDNGFAILFLLRYIGMLSAPAFESSPALLELCGQSNGRITVVVPTIPGRTNCSLEIFTLNPVVIKSGEGSFWDMGSYLSSQRDVVRSAARSR